MGCTCENVSNACGCETDIFQGGRAQAGSELHGHAPLDDFLHMPIDILPAYINFPNKD